MNEEYKPFPNTLSERLLQRLDDVVESAAGFWKTVLYMSYATIQRHQAFEQML